MIDDAKNDAVLLQQFVASGDEDAFAKVVARHGGLVLGVCRRILQNSADAEDAAQATFIALALKARRLRTRSEIAGWLHHVARHVALDVYKANQRRERRNQEYHAASEELASNASQPWMRELDTAIAALPAKLRTTVIQTYFEGLPAEAIARLEGCSPSAVSMRLTRARERLRKSLLRYGAAVALEGFLAAAAKGQAVGTPFTLQTAHRAVVAASGAAASELAMINLVAIAQETLRRLTLLTFRWPAIATVASICLAGVVMGSGGTTNPPRSSTTTPIDATPQSGANAPGTAMEATASSPVGPKIIDPPLIAALAKINRWSDIPVFKRALDAVPGAVDAVRDASGKTALHRAAQLGYTESMTLLLRRGANANAMDAQGRTPLFDAILGKSRWALEALVLWGADIDSIANDTTTPLTVALMQKDKTSAELLLWLGARTRLARVPSHLQPLVIAQASGDAELLAMVQDYDRSAGLTFAQQSRVIPPFIKNGLHGAARRADFVQLEDLVRAGQDLNQLDEKGKTPLHRAILGGHAEMVFYLLLLGSNANLPDQAGVTPFMESLAWMGDGAGNATRLFLIAKNANPYAIRKDGHSEITWAADRDNEHALQWLLWMGVDARQASRQGTPFQVAWRGGRKRALELLRANGIVEPAQLPTNPAELIQVACKLGDDALVEKALAAGTGIDTPDRDGNSPLMLAFLHRNIGTARLLIEHGADIHFQNPVNFQTPLCSTMPWSGPEVNALREELLDAGVDVNIKTKRTQTTPLIMALAHGPWLLRKLVEYGADIQARDKDGLTVLGHALKNGQKESATYLRSIGTPE